jgi:hypothetical protein
LDGVEGRNISKEQKRDEEGKKGRKFGVRKNGRILGKVKVVAETMNG